MPPSAEERAVRLERALEAPMLVAALLVVPLLIVEHAHVGRTAKEAATVANWVVWLAFLGEAVAMLAVVPSRRRWLRVHPVEVAVVVLTPPILPGPLQTIRILRLLRLVRLLALWDRVRRAFTLEGLRYAALVTLLVLLGGGVAFSDVEPHVSAWDGIWWSAVTMTTVGYGDVYPHTTAGRAIGLAVMFVGIGFGSLLVAGLAQHFASRAVEREVTRVEALEVGVEAAEQELLEELRAVRGRLEEIERMVARSRRGAG